MSTGTYESMLQLWANAIKASSKSRMIRYIATGNLLQFFGQEAIPKSKLIQFSTLDGKTRKGALMPESYLPDGILDGKVGSQKIIVPVAISV